MASWRELITASGLPPFEAQLLAARAAGQPRSWIIAHDDEEIPAQPAQMLQAWFARRRSAEPVAYILGEREFHGLMLEVTPEVLIPRPETELLVELAMQRLPQKGRLLDLGTGSGAIAVAAAQARPDAEIWASDISAGALDVARRNATRHGLTIRFLEGDLFEGMEDAHFEAIVSNPPYVAPGDPHLAAGDLPFEPRLALMSAENGHSHLRRIAEGARMQLRRGGWLLMEHGYEQGEACIALLTGLGYAEVADHTDLAGHARVISGRLR